MNRVFSLQAFPLKAFSCKALGVATLTASVLLANVALAEVPGKERHHLKGSYTSQVQQTETDNGFIRNTTTTNAQGETATHNLVVKNDEAAGTRSRSVTATNFKGEAYSNDFLSRKTDSGYVTEDRQVKDGKAVSRVTTAVIDKSAGTVTKTIATTPAGGTTTSETLVKKLKEDKQHKRGKQHK